MITATSSEVLAEGALQAQGQAQLVSELRPPTFHDDQTEQRAVASFFNDYVVISADRKISRGFLDGLRPLVNDAGPSSDIAQAISIIAIAGAANRIDCIDMLRKTKSIYGKLLGSFRSTLENPYTGSTVQSLTMAALLGIYEVCNLYSNFCCDL